MAAVTKRDNDNGDGGKSGGADPTTKYVAGPAVSLSKELRLHMKALGRRGGQSKSKRKVDAALVNVEKANAARWHKNYKGRIAKRNRK